MNTQRVTAAMTLTVCAILVSGLVVGMHSAGAATRVRKGPDAAGVTWLCRPGLTGNPCLYPESATSIAANGTKTVISAQPASNPPVDCFYVYPTVVPSATTDNSGTSVTGTEQATAVAQASQFSQLCNVWAPTYRQRTSASLQAGLGNDAQANAISYQSLLKGWKDYLANYNDGRPVVFIGHSQGAVNVIRLLRSQVDNNPKLRNRMVSAIILGGNVQVPVGKTVGGTFAHIPACTRTGQIGCVIAYSSFSSTPPANSLFGRPGQGVSLQGGQRARRGQQVVCTNPAALGSTRVAALSPYFVSSTSKTGEPWVTYPNRYTGQCKSKGGATWLQVTARPRDPRPVVTPTLGPTWGLHLDDVNLGLGNLLQDVHAQVQAYEANHSAG